MDDEPNVVRTHDQLPDASFPDAKKLPTGTVKLTSDDQEEGAIHIQAGWDRKSIGKGTTIDIVSEKGERLAVEEFDLVIEPQTLKDSPRGGFEIKNPNPGKVMVVWVNGEKIPIDGEHSITVDPADVVYAMVGEEQAIKLTKENGSGFTKTMNLKKFTLDDRQDNENDDQRMARNDSKEIGKPEKRAVIIPFEPDLKVGVETEISIKGIEDKGSFDFEKEDVIISTAEFTPPEDNKSYVKIKLVDESGKPLEDQDFAVSLRWNSAAQSYVAHNLSSKDVSWKDPISGESGTLKSGHSSSSVSGEIQFIVSGVDVNITSIYETTGKRTPDRLRFNTSRR